MEIRVISFTTNGQKLSLKIKEYLEGLIPEKKNGDVLPENENALNPGDSGFGDIRVELFTKCRYRLDVIGEQIQEVKEPLAAFAQNAFQEKTPLIFIGACGIAVRAIAPFVQDKMSDPPVLVLDEEGRFVIPLLSSHLGGGQVLGRQIAEGLCARLVETTASDVGGHFAVDSFARANGLGLFDKEKAKNLAADLVQGKHCKLALEQAYFEIMDEIPQDVKIIPSKIVDGILQDGETVPSHVEIDSDTTLDAVSEIVSEAVSDVNPAGTGEVFSDTLVLISHKKCEKDVLRLIPRNIILGVGCKKGKSAEELIHFILYVLQEMQILPQAVKCMASIDLKAQEEGLLLTSEMLNVPFVTFDAKSLKAIKGDFTESDFVEQTTGVSNVCERAAMSAGADLLLQKKISYQGMTLAVGIQKGRLYFA